MTTKQTPGVFTDAKSQRQIAYFKRFENFASRVYNEANLKRFDDNHRERWELEHLGEVK